MLRLGRFDKQGYKDNFSKGKLARELVYMHEDCYELQQNNEQQQKRIEYLERSNNRREEDIINLRNELCEINDYKEKWDKLKNYFKILKINSTHDNKKFIEKILILIQELEWSDNNEE